MKIVNLQAENFKRLRAVEISPDGTTVILSGKNAQGKSSVLDAIWATLAGREGVKETKRPIRDGEKKARVSITLDDIVVTRKWTASGSTLEVTARDGKAKFNSPQKMLDDLIGKLSFDPLAFAQEDPKKQLATLIELADLPFDPDALAAQRRAAYDERTQVNRNVKSLAGQLDALAVPEGVGDRVDVAALAGELQAAHQVKDRRDSLLAEHKRYAEKIRELEERIIAMQERSSEIVEEGRALPKTREIQEIVEEIGRADEINQAVDLAQKRQELRASLKASEDTAAIHTSTIELLDRRKAEGLAAAKFPVDGLGFDDEGVLYKGVPFQQASAAERLRVSVAMAMAMNPEARVILIRDGSLLDSDNMAAIESMCAEKDFQVWIERVDESGEIGVVIEDGMVKA